MSTLYTLYREPFSLGTPHLVERIPGQNLAELASSVDRLPIDFFERGRIAVNGEIIPKELWMRVRPKAETVVTFHAPVAGGGGGGGGKQVFALIAAIALTVATAGIGAGALAPVLGASFAAGTIGAAVLAGAVGLVGSLAISALTSPPVTRPQEEASASGNRKEPASVSGNVLEPNSPVPRVIGTRRVFPPFLGEPAVELVGQDEIVEAIYGLAGAHTITDLRLGDGSIDIDATDFAEVEIETREGDPDDLPLESIIRQARTLELNLEMSSNQVNSQQQDTLDDTVGNPLPVFHALTTRLAPDENWIQLLLTGLSRQDAPTDSLRIPFRVRMRRRGDANWRDLPEFQYQNATVSQVRLQFKIFWGSEFGASFPTAPSTIGWVAAYKQVPAQNVVPLGSVFDADAYFSNGAGNDLYENGTELTTNVRNVVLFGDRVEIYLDSDDWPEGTYDIEIKRGATFQDTEFTTSTYTYDGNILDFFGRTDAGTLPLTRDGLLDVVSIVRMVNIWNEYPIKQSGMALIALKARNRSVQRLSCVASGKVLDLQQGRGPLMHKPDATRGFISFDAAGAAVDVEILALTRVPPIVATDLEAPRIALRVTGGSGTENFYQFGFRYLTASSGATDAVAIDKFVAGSGANMTLAPFPWAFDQNFFLRFRAEGDTLKGKAWPASIPEPDEWSTELIDSDVSGAGRVGVSWSSGATVYDSYFNWFSVGLGGDTAPMPPDLSSALATDFSEQTIGNNLSGWTSRFGSITSVVSEHENFPYNGNNTDWDTVRTTSNPAPHFRDVLTGSLNFDPLPLELLDDPGVVDWWRRNALADFSCDMVVEGLEIADLLRVVSSTGYARLYRSEVWGVVQDKSRRLESPVQVFSPRNSNSLSWRKAFVRLPAGFRINFREEDTDYDTDQIVVYRQNPEGSGQRLEQTTYDGLVNKVDVTRRARFDLRQAEERSTFYSFRAPAESIICRRGSLIGLNHDLLSRQYGAARIDVVDISDGLVTGLLLDNTITVHNEPDALSTPNFLEVEDVLAVGLQTAVAIRDDLGAVTTHALATPSGETDEIEFENPISSYDIKTGNLVIVGIRDKAYTRLVVSEINYERNLEAQLVCVDEASEIFEEIFGAPQV